MESIHFYGLYYIYLHAAPRFCFCHDRDLLPKLSQAQPISRYIEHFPPDSQHIYVLWKLVFQRLVLNIGSYLTSLCPRF